MIRWTLAAVFARSSRGKADSARVSLAQLRGKLEEEHGRRRHLTTEPGVGYPFVP